MGIRKNILIDGVEVPFKASAAVPRLYRLKFRRDIFQDLQKLSKEVDASDEESSELQIDNLEMFENIAYIMAKHADPENVSGDINEWLDNFNTFSIYTVLPKILELWQENTETLSESKKKNVLVTEN